jgi:phosphoglycolate phosphatase-like HAD superfamily hydrolase
LKVIIGILFCQQAGYDYDEETFEKVFRRIYASFGSSAPYVIFPDSQPFLRWVREQGLIVGIVSNAEYRYKDVILPALNLKQVCKVFCFGLLFPKFLD